jgi:hypothetical protein
VKRDHGARLVWVFSTLATTWLLVKISPPAVRMMPGPSSDGSLWSVCSVTTRGNTFAAICSSGETGTLIADRPSAELGTNNWLPMVGGWTRNCRYTNRPGAAQPLNLGVIPDVTELLWQNAWPS